ncbi:MAG TPA: TIGR01244 family sulfur transferase [Allosphingosinicella sp.]|jgi:uncharacterized protein (TIGR01244 family)
MRQLDEKVIVAGQILPAQMMEIAAAGVTMVVNNRPDGEEPGQPASAEIAEAAAAAGLAYAHIPIARRFTGDDIRAMGQAIQGAGAGKVLAFCKSGTRSTYLWALARQEQGVPVDQLVANAAAAGFDLRPLVSSN